MTNFRLSDIPTAKIKRSDIIIDAIKRMIVEDQLRPGDRLPSEKELIEQFDSSRGTIRETLKSLEILDALRKEDKEKARTLMAEHMKVAFRHIVSLKAIMDNSLISRHDL
jgi:DNA-binding FadR family transcriptional regulator